MAIFNWIQIRPIRVTASMVLFCLWSCSESEDPGALVTKRLGNGAEKLGDPPEQYARSCSSCHEMGIAGAPITGDEIAWAPRLGKGMETLIASVRNGLNAMPPGGLCNSCTDEDHAALITYMASPQ